MFAENPPPVASIAAKLKESLTVKIFVLGFIVLVLLIPYFMAVGLRNERERYASNAEREVSSKWGGRQLVTAPVIRVPVRRLVKTKEGEKWETSGFFMLPEKTEISGEVMPEVRYRGIYQILLYRTDLKINAEFSALPGEFPDGWEKVADHAPEILIRVSDVKGIVSLSSACNGQNTVPVAGAIVSVPLEQSSWTKDGKLTFTAALALNGCGSLQVTPVGKQFQLALKSTWAHPSFSGGFLPNMREVSDQGFTAEWSVNELNSGCRQSWIGTLGDELPGSDDYQRESRTVGVSLVQPASTYVQVERVSDYAFLVISIVLVAFLIGEHITKIWIHPLQYFFAGLSLVMFYILLLALAEHIPFVWSYLISTVVIAGMTTMYCKMIFAKKRLAALLLGGIMLLAYALIYFLTRLEDYALLAGSVILLVLLGILMRATGNMNKTETE